MDMISLWQDMPVERPRWSINDLNTLNQRLERKIKRRNLVEYLSWFIVFMAFGFYIIQDPSVEGKITWGLILVGACLALWNLIRKTHIHQNKTTGALSKTYLTELVRQRDALRSAWRWYLLPLVPGLACFMGVGFVRAGYKFDYELFTIGLLVLAVFVGSYIFQLLSAAKLQKAIDLLDHALKDG